MQQFSFSGAWRGEERLSTVFWVYFFVPAVLFVFLEIPLFWKIASIVDDFSTAAFLIILAKITWYIWSIVSLINITKNSPKKGWGITSSITVIVYFVLNIVFVSEAIEGLSSI